MPVRQNQSKPGVLPTAVTLEGPLTFSRHAVEDFVRDAFRHAYGADVRHFMPTLMTLRNDEGTLLAALGVRYAGSAPLFLEQYLDRPVESVLAEAAAMPVDRCRLAEVGNFAVGAAGGGRWLITALTAFLYSGGQSWAVFTCGPELRNAFRRLGIPLLDLAAADPACLADGERASWGSYYDQRPRVMAANVAESHRVLAELFTGECAMRSLWHGALRAGRIAA
ncbi:MAG: thermostable hemolysin [Gammaproteobacteria bacterium]|nr:thermostable hemolysin [Gammaproteobacteria bacterium]